MNDGTDRPSIVAFSLAATRGEQAWLVFMARLPITTWESNTSTFL